MERQDCRLHSYLSVIVIVVFLGCIAYLGLQRFSLRLAALQRQVDGQQQDFARAADMDKRLEVITQSLKALTAEVSDFQAHTSGELEKLAKRLAALEANLGNATALPDAQADSSSAAVDTIDMDALIDQAGIRPNAALNWEARDLAGVLRDNADLDVQDNETTMEAFKDLLDRAKEQFRGVATQQFHNSEAISQKLDEEGRFRDFAAGEVVGPPDNVPKVGQYIIKTRPLGDSKRREYVISSEEFPELFKSKEQGDRQVTELLLRRAVDVVKRGR